MRAVAAAPKPIAPIVERLRTFYGLLPPPPTDPFILFVWEVLSERTVPGRRDAALAALRKMRALTPDAMWRAAHKNLQDAVTLAGLHVDDRMGALRSGLDVFRRSPELPAVIRGPQPAARRALQALPQFGEDAVNRMLLFAAGHAVLPVDERVNRVARRLGYGSGELAFQKSAQSVSRVLTSQLPAGQAEAFQAAFMYLSHHGASTCTEADPHCGVCPLLADCADGQKRKAERSGVGLAP